MTVNDGGPKVAHGGLLEANVLDRISLSSGFLWFHDLPAETLMDVGSFRLFPLGLGVLPAARRKQVVSGRLWWLQVAARARQPTRARIRSLPAFCRHPTFTGAGYRPSWATSRCLPAEASPLNLSSCDAVNSQVAKD